MIDTTQPTDTLQPAAIHLGVADSRRAGEPAAAIASSAAGRLHVELDGMIGRPVSDSACREAMLDCLLRYQNLAGGAWFSVHDGQAIADVARLPGSIFARKEVAQWLTDLATRAINERSDVVGSCPSVRNLRAICVPTIADRRNELRPGTRATSVPPGALVIATSAAAQIASSQAGSSQPVASSATPAESGNPLHTSPLHANPSHASQVQADDSVLMAGQCVVRAYRDWFGQQQTARWQEQLGATSSLLDLVGRIGRTDSTQAAYQTLVNALQIHFDVAFAAIAIKPPRHTVGRLQAVSGIGDFDANSQHAVRIESALNEALVRGELTVHPNLGIDGTLHLAHKRLAETSGVDAVVSVPITSGDETIVGAVLLGGAARQLVNDRTVAVLRAAQQPLGEAIGLSQQLEGGWMRRIARRGQRFVRQRSGMLTLAAAVLLAAAMFVPVTYHIGCRCQVQPVARRYALAPYDGMLENTFVQPGDEVHAGDLVARMEGRELSWELAGLSAEAERARKQRDVHRAGLAVADSMIADLELEKLLARESLLRGRLDQLELRSPVDGIVLGGSLDRREHFPVTTGQIIYEIAPLDQLRIEVAVPAEERTHVAPGMTVSIRMDGAAGDEVTGLIERVLPRSEIRNEQNVFVAEVLVDNPNGDLKPGMEGSVRIAGRSHALGWTMGHRAWERLMARVWW